jgi:hypothetical protein
LRALYGLARTRIGVCSRLAAAMAELHAAGLGGVAPVDVPRIARAPSGPGVFDPRDYRSSCDCRSATRRIRSMSVAEGVTLPLA